MQKLAELTSGDMLSSGIYPGLTETAPPLWADGSNVIFDNAGVRKNYGLLGLANLAYTPTGLLSTYAASEARAYIGGGTDAQVYRSGSGLVTIGSFASLLGQFQFVPWDTWALINNKADPVKLWKGVDATPAAAIGGITFSRANCIFQMGLRAFAAGTDNGGNLVEWCSLNNIEDWTPTILNSAGRLQLRSLVGDIVCCQPIGDSMGIYSSFNAGIFTQISGIGSYGFRRPIRGVSAVSQYSVVPVGDRHFGIAPDNAFVTDLVSSQNIDEPAVRNWTRDNVDWTRLQEVYGWLDRANSLVRWSLPALAGGSVGLGFRYDKGTWTKFNDDVVIGETSGVFQHMLLGKNRRLLRQDKTQFDNDLAAMGSSLQTKPLDFGSRAKLKRVQRVDFDGTVTGNVRLQIGYTTTPNEAPTWAYDEPLTAQSGTDLENTECEGVFVHIRISNEDAGANWQMSSAVIWGRETANAT